MTQVTVNNQPPVVVETQNAPTQVQVPTPATVQSQASNVIDGELVINTYDPGDLAALFTSA